MPQDNWLTVSQAAKVLDLSTVRVYDIIRAKEFRSKTERMLNGRDITVVNAQDVLARKSGAKKHDVMAQFAQLERELNSMARHRDDVARHKKAAAQALGLARYLKSYVAGRR